MTFCLGEITWVTCNAFLWDAGDITPMDGVRVLGRLRAGDAIMLLEDADTDDPKFVEVVSPVGPGFIHLGQIQKNHDT